MKPGSQDFLVVKLPPSAERAIGDLLARENALFETCENAFFRARLKGCVVTFYKSGKLLLQGPEFKRVANLLELEIGDALDRERFHFPAIGSDESGKGDFFGPLCVAGVLVEEEKGEEISRSRVQDSKKISDSLAITLAGWIEKEFPCSVEVLMPEEYNKEWHSKGRNLNNLLVHMHGRVIKKLLKEAKKKQGLLVLVDKFGPEEKLKRELEGALGPVSLKQVVRAEAHPAVAAASILARAAFIEGLEQCSRNVATDLPKGAGENVRRAARRVLSIGGNELLSKVCKMHFKIKGLGSFPWKSDP